MPSNEFNEEINLMQKKLYTENCKTVLKEIKDLDEMERHSVFMDYYWEVKTNQLSIDFMQSILKFPVANCMNVEK